MKKHIAVLSLLVLILTAGCAALSSLSAPPPNMVTAAVIEQVMKDRPEWAQAARDIARTVTEQAGPGASLAEMEILAYAEIDKKELPPAQRELARSMVTGVRKALEADLAALGIVTAAERALRVAEFVAWMGGV